MRENNYIKCIILYFACLLFVSNTLFARDIFGSCNVYPKSFEIGNCCVIKLSVYTKTWFDEGVHFPQMKNQQGVLLKKGRSYVSQDYLNDERYSLITQEYWYYPFDEGNYVVEFENIEVSSPKVGEFKGIMSELSFPSTKITVKRLPILSSFEPSKQSSEQSSFEFSERSSEQSSFESLKRSSERSSFEPSKQSSKKPLKSLSKSQGNFWKGSIAKSLKLQQKWTYADTLHLHDVVTREIVYKANGVPAAFISPEIFSSNGVGYNAISEQPVFTTKLSDAIVNGEVHQSVLYQLRDTGVINLPAVSVTYWNSKRRKLDSVSLEGHNIYVQSSNSQIQEGDSVGQLTKVNADEDQSIWTSLQNCSLFTKILILLVFFGLIKVGLFLLVYKRNKRVQILVDILFCRDSYKLYDLLYEYTRLFTPYSTFRDFASNISNNMLRCYDKFSASLFSLDQSYMPNFFVRCRICFKLL